MTMWRACVAMAVTLISVATAAAQAGTDSIGSVAARIVPETVKVGQPFELTLRAVPAAGRQAVAPAVPDTGGLVEPLDPAVVTRRGDTLFVRYRLLAWQPGVLTIPVGPVIMRRDSADLSVPVDARIVVASVLPADSASRVPKDARGLIPVPLRWWERWWRWVAGAVLAIAVVLLALRWWRDRARRLAVPAPTQPVAIAQAAFARLDARGLIAAGEGGRHVTLGAEIVREYLGAIVAYADLSHTNLELRRTIARRLGVPDAQMVDYLTLVDAVRFSGAPVDAGTARHVGALAQELVRDIERARVDAAAAERAA